MTTIAKAPLTKVKVPNKKLTNKRLKSQPKDKARVSKYWVIELASSPVLSSKKSVIGAIATTTTALVEACKKTPNTRMKK